MKPVFLGFDTSNYRTSVAAVERDGTLCLNFRQLLPVDAGERGLRQSDAVFQHVRQLRTADELLRQVTREHPVAGVAVSVRPGDPEDSYMPVFQVGHTVAAMLAAALGVPLMTTTHQRGHLAAAALHTGFTPDRPGLAVHLSGGTTDLLFLNGEELTRLGRSLDLHAGQLVDRVGVAMGLPFPSGPMLEQLAGKGKSAGRLGCSMAEEDCSCHFSGAESQAQRWLASGALPKEDIAREIYDLLARTLCRLLRAGAGKTGAKQALIAGGVAASPLLRQLLEERVRKQMPGLRLFFGQPELSGDNAVGVALLGWAAMKEEHE